MTMSAQIKELHDIQSGTANADISTDRAGAWVAVKDARRILAITQTGAVTDGDVVTVEIEHAQDSSGSESDSAATAQVTASGTDPVTAKVEIQVSELPALATHVRAVAGCDAAVAGAAVLVLGDLRTAP